MMPSMPQGRIGRRANEKRARKPRGCRPTIEAMEARQLLSGDMVLHWDELGVEASKVDHGLNYPTEQFGPTRTSRAMAIESVAIYDAVSAVDGTYQPYLTHATVPANTSMDAAVAQAGHDALSALYTHQVAMFDQALAADLAAIPDGPGKQQGIALGKLTAANTLAARANDGSQLDAVGQPVNYIYGTLVGQWGGNPARPEIKALTPDWGSVTPFVMTSGTEFRLPPPPALDSPEYTAAYNEVKSVGGSSPNSPSTRTDEETTIGLFWGYDSQPGVCAPIRFYNQIADVIARQQGNTEVQNSRMFLLVNVAMADAAIACWGDKFYYALWRPVAAIQQGNLDGNPDTVGDPLWTPLGAPADNHNGDNFTPPFPAYPSGHADIGGALFTVLKDFYGTDNIHFTIVSDEFNTITVDQNGIARPLKPRSYTSFTQAMEENGESRIYLGVHFHFDMVAGIQQGSEIGNLVFSQIGKSAMGDNAAFATKAYRDLTGVRADAATLAGYTATLNAGASHDVVLQQIEQTDAYRNHLVSTEYQQLFHRAPTTRELQSGASFLKHGGTQEQLEVRLMGSRAFLVQQGGGTVRGFLNAASTDMMGQSLTASQRVSIRRRLRAGASRPSIVRTIQDSPTADMFRTQTLYQQFLRHAPDVAGSNAMTTSLLSGTSIEHAKASLMSTPEYSANH